LPIISTPINNASSTSEIGYTITQTTSPTFNIYLRITPAITDITFWEFSGEIINIPLV
jgi:hypothetical protein